MNIHLHQNGKQHGPYPLEQIKAWLVSGQISPTVMAQLDGDPGWIPLHCVPQIRDDESLEMIIRSATSGDLEIEVKILQETLKEIDDLLSTSGDPASRA